MTSKWETRWNAGNIAQTATLRGVGDAAPYGAPSAFPWGEAPTSAAALVGDEGESPGFRALRNRGVDSFRHGAQRRATSLREGGLGRGAQF